MSLKLIEVTPHHQALLTDGLPNLSDHLKLDAPDGWPAFPYIRHAALTSGWPFFIFVDESSSMIVGCGGFLGPPDESGFVQIGYEVAPAFRRQGIATRALTQIISSKRDARVVAVVSEDNQASTGMLQKLGFQKARESIMIGGQFCFFWTLPLQGIHVMKSRQLSAIAALAVIFVLGGCNSAKESEGILAGDIPSCEVLRTPEKKAYLDAALKECQDHRATGSSAQNKGCEITMQRMRCIEKAAVEKLEPMH